MVNHIKHKQRDSTYVGKIPCPLYPLYASRINPPSRARAPRTHNASHLREHPLMTSENLLDILTPPPLVCI